MVDAGTALFTLLDVSRMEVVADIPVAEYQQRDRFTRYFCQVAGSEGELPMQLLSLTPRRMEISCISCDWLLWDSPISN